MSQDKDGGYCPRCDTVWASPGKCRCAPIEPNKEIIEVLAELCAEKSAYEKEIWNAAIEAAAKRMDEMGEEERITLYIRELKK